MQPKFGGYLQHFTAQDVAYFRDMPFSLSIPSHGVLVAHAGIVPEKPLEQQLLIDMLNVRDCSQIGASVLQTSPSMHYRVLSCTQLLLLFLLAFLRLLM